MVSTRGPLPDEFAECCGVGHNLGRCDEGGGTDEAWRRFKKDKVALFGAADLWSSERWANKLIQAAYVSKKFVALGLSDESAAPDGKLVFWPCRSLPSKERPSVATPAI